MNAPTIRELMIFLGSFCIGLLIVALIEPRPEVIVRWPTPKNTGLVTYLDRASNCYQYSHEEVGCDDKEKKIPIQNGEGMETQINHGHSHKDEHNLDIDDFFP